MVVGFHQNKGRGKHCLKYAVSRAGMARAQTVWAFTPLAADDAIALLHSASSPGIGILFFPT